MKICASALLKKKVEERKRFSSHSIRNETLQGTGELQGALQINPSSKKKKGKNIYLFLFLTALQSKKICFDKVFGIRSALHRSVADFAEETAKNWAVKGQRAALLDEGRSCDPSLKSHFVYSHRRRTLGWNSRDVRPSIEQNSANWYLRFVSLWGAFTWEPPAENLPCRPEPQKQLCLWSAPFTLTLFELCFPLAFWECWVKKKKK